MCGLLVSLNCDMKKRIGVVSIFFVTAVCVLVPWGVRNYRVCGAIIPVSGAGGYVLYQGNSADATGGTGGMNERGVDYQDPKEAPKNLTEIQQDSYLRGLAVDFIKKNPGRFVELALIKFWNMWRPYHADTRMISKIVMCASYVPIVVLALAGFLLSLKEWRRHLVFYLLLAYYIGVHMILLGLIRYRYPMEPLLVIYGAYTVDVCLGQYCRSAGSRGAVSNRHSGSEVVASDVH
jgi:hypothetical protein